MVYGDYHGRIVEDYQKEYDLDGVVSVPISIRATFPFYFGDDPELVKQFRLLYAMTQTGTNAADAIILSVQSLDKSPTAPQAVATINGAHSPAGANRMQHIPMPPSLDGVNNKDRGAQIVVTGQAQSGPLTIQELTVKYQESGYRSKP